MWRAIIIDDEPIVREVLVSYIAWADLNLEVIDTCEDGVQALPRILDQKPDIVLTDIFMPGLSGIELLEQLRSQGAACEVIIVSGSSEFAHAQRAVQLGAFDYLLKPIGADTLRTCLEKCINKLAAARREERLEALPVSEHYSIYTQRALQYIHAHFREPLQLGTVARDISISKSHLSKVFKEDTGSAFNEYLIAYRMNAAHALLREGSYKIYEVAAMVGYTDVVHFSKMFKKAFNVSPKHCANL